MSAPEPSLVPGDEAGTSKPSGWAAAARPLTTTSRAAFEEQRRAYLLQPARQLWSASGGFEAREELPWMWMFSIVRSVPPRRDLNRLKHLLSAEDFGTEESTGRWFKCFRFFLAMQDVRTMLDRSFLFPFILHMPFGHRSASAALESIFTACDRRMAQLREMILETQEGFALRHQSTWAEKAATSQLRKAFAEYEKEHSRSFDAVECNLPLVLPEIDDSMLGAMFVSGLGSLYDVQENPMPSHTKHMFIAHLCCHVCGPHLTGMVRAVNWMTAETREKLVKSWMPALQQEYMAPLYGAGPDPVHKTAASKTLSSQISRLLHRRWQTARAKKHSNTKLTRPPITTALMASQVT